MYALIRHDPPNRSYPWGRVEVLAVGTRIEMTALDYLKHYRKDGNRRIHGYKTFVKKIKK